MSGNSSVGVIISVASFPMGMEKSQIGLFPRRSEHHVMKFELLSQSYENVEVGVLSDSWLGWLQLNILPGSPWSLFRCHFCLHSLCRAFSSVSCLCCQWPVWTLRVGGGGGGGWSVSQLSSQSLSSAAQGLIHVRAARRCHQEFTRLHGGARAPPLLQPPPPGLPASLWSLFWSSSQKAGASFVLL